MSQTNNYDSSAQTKFLKSRTLALYKKLNPLPSDLTGSQGSEAELLDRHLGEKTFVRAPPSGPVIVTPPCCNACGNITVAYDYLDNNGSTWVFMLLWSDIPGVTSYNLSANRTYTLEMTGKTSANITFDWNGGDNVIITVSASNGCTSGTASIFPCFLAGSTVHLGDGTTKLIEDVKVGDVLLGAFGEHNPVLALHRPLLGSGKMTKINGEHSTTSHHPHISVDKKFYCQHPDVVENSTYGKEHEVINADGVVETRLLQGLKKGRVQTLVEGVELKTVDGGKPVVTLEIYSLGPETQLYNLVMGGSHTYHVDGYAVTGWPREDDFDYDTWTSKA
jgi:hypothetical protein